MMVINNKYDFGDIVYLKTDPEQNKRVVVGINVTPNGDILYRISQGTINSDHYDFEISEEKDFANAV